MLFTVFMMVCALGFVIVSRRVLAHHHALVGTPAPALKLAALSGDEVVDLTSFKGQVVVLDFWAPWCGPCRRQMPILDELSRRLSKDIVVVGVLVDPDRTGARAMLQSNGVGYRQLDDRDGLAARAFSVSSLPSVVVIDRQGRLAAYHTGLTTAGELEASIDAAR